MKRPILRPLFLASLFLALFSLSACDPSCEDSCIYANDGVCDDGGDNATTTLCDYGTDCTDCGAR